MEQEGPSPTIFHINFHAVSPEVQRSPQAHNVYRGKATRDSHSVPVTSSVVSQGAHYSPISQKTLEAMSQLDLIDSY